jgi:hypothetical protein
MNSEYVFFFNNMKKEMGNINCHLNEIIKIYESLIDSIENFGKDKINNQEDNTDSMIQENCEHNYILDTIDSGIDSSINIEYCVKCYKVRE